MGERYAAKRTPGKGSSYLCQPVCLQGVCRWQTRPTTSSLALVLFEFLFVFTQFLWRQNPLHFCMWVFQGIVYVRGDKCPMEVTEILMLLFHHSCPPKFGWNLMEQRLCPIILMLRCFWLALFCLRHQYEQENPFWTESNVKKNLAALAKCSILSVVYRFIHMWDLKEVSFTLCCYHLW